MIYHLHLAWRSANVEISKVRAAHERELTMLRARLGRAELQVGALSTQLESKKQENAELTKICDQLMAQEDQRVA